MQRNLLVQFLGGGGAVMYFRYPTFEYYRYTKVLSAEGRIIPAFSVFIV